MQKTFLLLGALFGGLSVVLGAFGAHGLRKIAGPDTVATYLTGVQYQMYHAFALILTGILIERYTGNLMQMAGIFFISGIIFFSGSLYIITSLQVMKKTISPIVGICTPFGGLLFVIAWILLLIAILRK